MSDCHCARRGETRAHRPHNSVIIIVIIYLFFSLTISNDPHLRVCVENQNDNAVDVACVRDVFRSDRRSVGIRRVCIILYFARVHKAILLLLDTTRVRVIA